MDSDSVPSSWIVTTLLLRTPVFTTHNNSARSGHGILNKHPDFHIDCRHFMPMTTVYMHVDLLGRDQSGTTFDKTIGVLLL
jgi:hypothetical protein